MGIPITTFNRGDTVTVDGKPLREGRLYRVDHCDGNNITVTSVENGVIKYPPKMLMFPDYMVHHYTPPEPCVGYFWLFVAVIAACYVVLTIDIVKQIITKWAY